MDRFSATFSPVSNEGLVEIRPVPLGCTQKTRRAALESLPIAGYTLRLTPARTFFAQQRGCDISVSRPWISSGEEGYRVGELLFLAFLQPPPGLFFHQD